METLSNAVVLGYHGCHIDVGQSVLDRAEHLRRSENDYDWLGSGIYFWEADPIRGLEWARDRYGTADACVIGAAIHLGRSLNLMSRHAYNSVAEAYGELERTFALAEIPLPQNVNNGMVRKLDRAVIEHLHRMRADNKPEPLRPYDTVRGLFIEGKEAFPGSMLRSKTHVQICVREPRVIKGYFRVFQEHVCPPTRL
ncbi:MAG: hypothetical protein HQL38_00390 [Alphaproteobacteria bacterium]|nr:hypothetical protein [Alphaproteobacteria bacterium]